MDVAGRARGRHGADMELTNRHPSVAHFGPLFEYAHLPEGRIRATSAWCAELAENLITELPDGPELSAGLRKLLEAKDCFVRAAVLAKRNEE
jgi:hypothetical protein